MGDGDERLVIFSLAAVTRRHLFATARSMLAEEGLGDEADLGPALAVVIAQAAVEVGMETAVSFGLRAFEVHEGLQTWIEEKSVRPWSPDNGRVRTLWKALTGDVITKAEGWQEYAEGVKLRHDFAHQAQAVQKDAARDIHRCGREGAGPRR